jgi:hypothetical protein
MIAQLGIEEKIYITKKLEEETWETRFDRLLSKIWRRVEDNPISEEEVWLEVEKVRKERYIRSRR